MQQQDLIGFLNLIKTSIQIQKKLEQASDAEAEAISRIAQDAGFNIPVDELKKRGRWWENLPG